MAHYRAVGEIPPKRHTQFRRPDGGLYYEELVGQQGFSSDSSLLYHRHIPAAIVATTPWRLPGQSIVAHRSEERRGGEEGRSRWSAYHLKKKNMKRGGDW